MWTEGQLLLKNYSLQKLHLQELYKTQNRAAGILTNSHYDADAKPYQNTLRLKTIQDLIDTVLRTMVFKAPNDLAPEYLSDLFIKNSESHLRALRNTNTDLKLPKKATNKGKKCFPIEV